MSGPTQSWRLQHRAQPANQPPSQLGGSGFSSWYNPPPFGQPDPLTIAENRRMIRQLAVPGAGGAEFDPSGLPGGAHTHTCWLARAIAHMMPACCEALLFRLLSATSSSPDEVNSVYVCRAGKRTFPERPADIKYEGKRHYTEVPGSRPIHKSEGLKTVDSRAKRLTAADSNPNTVSAHEILRPEGVKSFQGVNDTPYSCWMPETLDRAQKGDWTLNTRFGNRKIS